MKRLLRVHERLIIQIVVVEEDGAPAERITSDTCILFLSNALVEELDELPGAVTLPLEEDGRVVVAAANVCVLTYEAAAQDRASLINNALSLRLRLRGDVLLSDVAEVHLAVV